MDRWEVVGRDTFTRPDMLFSDPPWGSRGRRFKSCQPDFVKGQLSWPFSFLTVNASGSPRHIILPERTYGFHVDVDRVLPTARGGSAASCFRVRAALPEGGVELVFLP